VFDTRQDAISTAGDCPFKRKLRGCLGSLCKPLHSDPYAQVATMRRWSAADDAAPIMAERGQVERVKIWT